MQHHHHQQQGNHTPMQQQHQQQHQQQQQQQHTPAPMTHHHQHHHAPAMQWSVPLSQLSANLQEAAELASVLTEAANIQFTGAAALRRLTSRASTCSGASHLGSRLSRQERIRRAAPLDVGGGPLPWQSLVGVVSAADALQEVELELVELNSGGQVYLLFFAGPAPACGGPPQDRIAVLKVGANRLAMAAELFANQISRHLGIAAPDCRIVRQACDEWSDAVAAVQRRADIAASATLQQPAGAASTPATAAEDAAAELLGELQALRCCLLLAFVPGGELFSSPDALDPVLSDVGLVCEDVGRLLMLDMLLGNADRMACPALHWRGNPHNLLLGAAGSRHAGRAVAIDSCVARRPPASKATAEDAAVERLAQLMLAVPEVSEELLQQLLGGLRRQQREQARCRQQQQQQTQQPRAVGSCMALSMDGSSSAGCGTCTPSAPLPPAVQQQQEQQQQEQQQPLFTSDEVARFQLGLRRCLAGVVELQGLLEMISARLAEWIAELVADVVHLNPQLMPGGGGGAAGPASSGIVARSPRPSPRPSLRNMSLEAGGGGARTSSLPPASPLVTSAAGASGAAPVSPAAAAAATPPGGTADTEEAAVGGGSGSSGGKQAGHRKRLAGASQASVFASGPPDALSVTHATTEELAMAVTAALSPRTTASQVQVLTEVFGIGGRSGSKAPGAARAAGMRGASRSFTGSPGASAAGAPAAAAQLGSCARRMTWSSNANEEPGGAADAACVGAPGSPPQVPPPSDQGAAAGVPAAASSPLPVPLAAAGAAGTHASGGSSVGGSASSQARTSSPSPLPPAHSPFPAWLCASPPQPNPWLTRPPSLTPSSGGSAGGAGGSRGSSITHAASAQQQQQQQQQHPVAAAAVAAAAPAAGSSLQVLASLQLDATLASIQLEARHDGVLGERLAHWKHVFRERGRELAAAIAAWQARHSSSQGAGRVALGGVLSTGFLDGSTNPVVDAYELGVRLQHLLRRLSALSAGALVQAPVQVLPRLYLGSAVAADSHHLLRHLGITHVVNAAVELQQQQQQVYPAADGAGAFAMLRVPLTDEEHQDLSCHMAPTTAWIEAALAGGGAVLVHCHEGKSRSVALVVAFLMLARGSTLSAALEHVCAVRPCAAPQAAFVKQLMQLDERLHGRCSLDASAVPRTKPRTRVCGICGEAVGVSYERLTRHTRAVHGLSNPPQEPPSG